jgi:hypothetical protein
MWKSDEECGDSTGLEGEDCVICDCFGTMGIRGFLHTFHETDYVSGKCGRRGIVQSVVF